MSVLASLLLVSLAANSHCAAGATDIYRLKNHGHGFCEATILVKDNVGWESIRHINHCFYMAQDFGECHGMSVSPSGSLAIWQAAPNGSVVIYRPGWKAPVVLLKEFSKPSALKSVAWNEPNALVTVKAWDDPTAYSFAIPSGG